MKRTLTLGILLYAVNLLIAQIDPYLPDPNPPAVLPGYRLVWSDEFNIPGKPSSENWSYETGFVRNNEHQWYQSDNASVANGSLRLTGRRETFRNPNYEAGSSDWKKSREYVNFTSASIHGRGKQSFRYGRFEIRAKIPAVNGAWPAIWTLGDWGEWPTNGEIDIMEYYGDGILANAAWGSSTRWQGVWDSSKKPMSHFRSKDPDWANKYHIWVMDWTPEFIKIYLDGELLNTIETAKTRNADGSNPFTSRNHYVLLNLALGGNNGGDPWSPSYPLTYYVDYVRVYQVDPNYSIRFNPLNPSANLAPDPECNAANPAGEGARGRNRNPLKVYSGSYSGEITGGVYAQHINWSPGKSYRVRAMVNVADTGVVLGINGLGEDADVVHRIGHQPGKWQQVDFMFTAPATAGAGGGIYYAGAAGSLIDNVEVYESTATFFSVSRSHLSFTSNKEEEVVAISSNGQSGNILLTAPNGITLDRQFITAEEARLGAYVTVRYTGQSTLNGQFVRVMSSLGTHDISVQADRARVTTRNLLENWDANGALGSGSEPDKMGWSARGSVAWNMANAATGVRYSDQTTTGSYTFNGEKWEGRALHLRWDSGVSPESHFAYPVDLFKGRYYTLSGLYAWQANGSEFAIYSIGINSQPDNSGVSCMAHHKTILRVDRFKLFDFLEVFTVPEDGRYYLTVTNTASIMGAVADLKLREGIHLPSELTVLPLSLSFSDSKRSNVLAFNGKYIHEDIQITAPDGILMSTSSISSDAINVGVVTLTATFDGSRTIAGEEIVVTSGDFVRRIPVTATEFPTSLLVTDQPALKVDAWFEEGVFSARLSAADEGIVDMELYNIQGERRWYRSLTTMRDDAVVRASQKLPTGVYMLRVTSSEGTRVLKVINQQN
jgi:beta-glucanase (GH16 family)